MKKLAFVFVLLAGCATAGKMKSINVGMTKAEVIKTLGKPSSITERGGVEAWRYEFFDSTDDAFLDTSTQYRVFLKKGRVTKFDKPGEFASE